MSFKDKLSALIPKKKEEAIEYFFALNIGHEVITAGLWAIENNKQLKILETASSAYSSHPEIVSVTDKLLDAVLGIREIEPQKILFGVPSNWLSDDNLKEEYLKLLRDLVKELELAPLAYVSTSNAIIHLLEKQEGVPTTAILVGFEAHHLTVTVVRAGKLDGVKNVLRGDNSGTDIEKALLTFTDVETLPSKLLIYGLEQDSLAKLKNQLLSFPWMSKLSFLHLPKIDILSEGVEIKGTCFAGATELDASVSYHEAPIKQAEAESKNIEAAAILSPDDKNLEELQNMESKEIEQTKEESDDFGFVVGDVSSQLDQEEEKVSLGEEETAPEDDQIAGGIYQEKESNLAEVDDFERRELESSPVAAAATLPIFNQGKKLFNLKRFFPKKNFVNLAILFGIIAAASILAGAILVLPKAEVKLFAEPRILERDTQVTADPNQKEVDETAKVIPGEVGETEVSGSLKEAATGKRQVGDPAKGTIKLINNTSPSKSHNFSKGVVVTSSGGVKFTLDTAVSLASSSATSESKETETTTVTASVVGADGNLPSGTQFTIAGVSSSDVAVVSEGNFAGGTSKEVTVVSDADQKRLLASLASDLRRQAQQKLQEKLPDKKILEESLSEEIVRRSYSKNINDQASEFALNLTIRFKGTAFDEKDLRLIVSKLVDTQVPDGFELNLSQTETQADVSKVEKDGRIIFLARFKAKLMPKIDVEEVKRKIRAKTPQQVEEIVKQMENILGAEVILTPSLPSFLQRVPILTKNINVEVGLK